MSTIKKLLALVLALTMVLSVSAAAAYSVVPYGDADGIAEGAAEAVEMLYNMGIMKGDDKGNFNPNATITRAEVAKMIYVVLNYGKDDLAKNYTGAKFFSDVVPGEWYEGYVNYAASIKLVQGRPDGTFGPNDPVTCAEAAKMLLTAIGYSAEARGYVGAGWDKQVLSDAAIIGLLDGYDYNTNTYAPRQWVAVMFKNALTDALTYSTIAPVVFNGLLTGINTDYYDYETMGQKYFGLYYWSGIIVANEYADLRDDDVLGAGRTKIDDVAKEFKNWTTGLTEIGEYREGWAISDGTSRDLVVYVTGEADNKEWDNDGKEVSDITSKSKIGGMKLDGNTEYYVDFEEVSAKEFGTYVGNGNWLRVVHNDSESTYAEYVFLTTFEMTEVSKVAKDGTVTLLIKDEDGDKISSDDYVLSADVEAGDIVLYTAIDGVEYVTLADSFTGKVSKYTYSTDTLTVDGEDYAQSDIAYTTIKGDYFDTVATAAKKTEYTFYQDFFGNIRVYSRSKADTGELVLLTDAFFATGRKGAEAAVDAYLNGEITEIDVDYDVDYTDVEMFIESAPHNNKWGVLTEYETQAWTNIARTSIDEDGVMSLYSAQTYKYNAKGEKYAVKADYIDLNEDKDVKAGQTAYDGEYITFDKDGKEVRTPVTMQVTKNTLFYYVDEDLNIVTVTGYKNSFDVIDEYVTINAMYAVATDTNSDADGDPYWVADVVVIETVYPVFNLGNNVVLGYNVVNKTVSDFAYLDVLDATGAEDDLNVINYNGYNTFKADEILTPEFYYNTEDEDGDSHIRVISGTGYAANDIYAGTLDRVNKLLDYVVLETGKTFYYDENTVVYDMYTKTSRGYVSTYVTNEDDNEDALTLDKGESYILVVDKDDTIIYAIWVEANDDVAYDLFAEIQAPGTAAGKAELAEAVEAYMEQVADVLGEDDAKFDWPTGSIAAATAAVKAEVENCTTAAEVEALGDFAMAADCNMWELVAKPVIVALQNDAAAAAAAATLAAIKTAVDGKTVNVTDADVDGEVKAAVEALYADATYTVVVTMQPYFVPTGSGIVAAVADVVITFGELTEAATVNVRIAH